LARPLPELVLFVDECLGATDVPNALRAAGIRCELLHDHFPPGTTDAQWLEAVGRRGWVVITKDQRIRRRQTELQALLSANLAAFVLTSGNLTGAAMGAAFVRGYPRMRKMLRDYELPFLATIDAGGRVGLLTAANKRASKHKDA
jgi:predicted nuclease of predicted toxin-antitoxin system